MTTHPDGTPGTYPGGYAPASPQAAPSLPPEPPTSAAPARSAAVASRTTRRALIISVLVVLVGGVLAFGAAQVLTRHTQVLAVSQDVTVGAMITDADLSVASVTKDPNISSIPASERSQIVGMIARVGLVKGELLTRAQVGTSSGFAPGEMLVALALKQGEFPVRGLTAGQTVLIVATPGANGSTSGAGSGAGSGSSSNGAGTGSFSPGIDGTVAEVGTMNPATQVTVIDVRVSQSDGVSVARLASTGNLAVILLPAGR